MKLRTAVLLAGVATLVATSGAHAMDPAATSPAWDAENARARARAEANLDPTYEMTGPGLVKYLVTRGQRYEGEGRYWEPRFGHRQHGWQGYRDGRYDGYRR